MMDVHWVRHIWKWLWSVGGAFQRRVVAVVVVDGGVSSSSSSVMMVGGVFVDLTAAA